MWQFITGWSSGQNARTFSMVLVDLWTHVAESTVQHHTHQSLLYRQMGWSCVSFCRKMCNNYIHGFLFFFFLLLNNAVCTVYWICKSNQSWSTIKIQNILYTWRFGDSTIIRKLDPSPRECLVQISQLFWFFLVPTYFFNY